jgi:DNA-binding NarL/FixJ family response regulator
LDFIGHEAITVAIVDLKMYPTDGVALLGEIKKRFPSTQVVVITNRAATLAAAIPRPASMQPNTSMARPPDHD